MNHGQGIKVWTDDEMQRLARIYPVTATPDLVEVFGCSVKFIQRIASKNGIKKCPVWLKQYKSDLSKALYAKNDTVGFRPGQKTWNHGQRKDQSTKNKNMTGHGFQHVLIVPGGRIVTHKIADICIKTASRRGHQ